MKKGLMIGLSVLLFVALLIVLKAGRENGGDIQVKGSSFLENLTIVQKKDGQPLWTLTASRADFKENEDKAELSDINLVMEKDHVTLQADKGLYDLSGRSFTTDSAVKAMSRDYRITADSIDYEVASGMIQTQGRIHLESKGFGVEGEGMKSEADHKVRILNDVKATFHR
jgi:lipopolysaccharide assembly outer membrane protein LptD (OstA)